MGKPVFYIVFTLFIAFHLKSQENLVPNGSFEEYNWCPNYTDGAFITACKYWTMPTLGTPDYFNACSTDSAGNPYLMFSVPQNYVGFQYAHSGNAYAGLIFVHDGGSLPTNSEYIQIQLNKQLESGKLYHLSFYVNCSQLVNNSKPICTNSIGALFTENAIGGSNYDISSQSPQFQSDLNQFFCDSLRWYELNHIFEAKGNENYLTIGVFTPVPILRMTDYEGNLLSGASVYYFIDDVSLIELDYMSLIDGKIPNVFTPNGDGVNDVFTFDNNLIHAKKFTILNRWGNVVYESDSHFSWDGKYQEKDSTEGIYFYRIEVTEQIRLNGFIQLIR